jgi:hypothetical protein
LSSKPAFDVASVASVFCYPVDNAEQETKAAAIGKSSATARAFWTAAALRRSAKVMTD